MTTNDPVNNPSHYTSGKIEVIDFIEDQKLGYHEGNAIKHVCRAKRQGNEIQDLEKARWYLDRIIARAKGESTQHRMAGFQKILDECDHPSDPAFDPPDVPAPDAFPARILHFAEVSARQRAAAIVPAIEEINASAKLRAPWSGVCAVPSCQDSIRGGRGLCYHCYIRFLDHRKRNSQASETPDKVVDMTKKE